MGNARCCFDTTDDGGRLPWLWRRISAPATSETSAETSRALSTSVVVVNILLWLCRCHHEATTAPGN